ncbi:flagellar biosynthetic protein FliR [Candidatus Sumerlaeota bacterium]|nr:flagellar biosynthetic protein FliR [Candidatus Sumerlaeota bacterium]
MLEDPQFLSLALSATAIFARVTLIFAFMPLLGEAFMPVRVRILLCLGITACLLPTVSVDITTLPTTLGGFTLVLIPEFLLAMTLGLTAKLVFAAVQFAGQAAGEQIGFGIANVIDPTNSSQISITAQAYFLFSLLLFLALDGHHILLGALVASFEVAPLFSVSLGPEIFQFINDEVAHMFALAVMIAAPILVAMLLVNMALGLIAKAVPQINIFIESFPIRIALGLLIMALTFGALGALLADEFARLDLNLGRALQLMQ